MDDLLGEDWKASPRPPVLQPHNPTSFASNLSSLRGTPQPNGSVATSPLNLSRPSSAAPIGTNSPFNAPKNNVDAFGNLTGLKTSKAGPGLSIQERQRQLAEERQKQLQAQGSLWDSLGASSRSNGVRQQADDENDILAAFNKDAKVDKSSHFPPPSVPASEPVSGRGTPANGLNQHSYGDYEDDDTFGLNGLASKSNGVASKGAMLESMKPQPIDDDDDDDDILGDLSRPVTTRPAARRQATTDSSDEGWDEIVANTTSTDTKRPNDPALSELVEMGFPEDTAKIALAENGGDVQRAVGWLLQQAHEESKQKAKEQQRSGRQSPPRASRSPPRRARGDEAVPSWMKQESRSSSNSRQPSQTNGEKDAAQIAQDYGSKF
ncbi:hypothetical protein AMS68_007691 [Peltaster fructicola]|uniref:UBA domain-containing protein n=1 Tax=Peltaster fructicola TaxID=286661 RepID=A0A6H0Y581_9PEZI|nr:hypothetical protein AMS68_007691 [Peltaster fructicola]